MHGIGLLMTIATFVVFVILAVIWQFSLARNILEEWAKTNELLKSLKAHRRQRRARAEHHRLAQSSRPRRGRTHSPFWPLLSWLFSQPSGLSCPPALAPRLIKPSYAPPEATRALSALAGSCRRKFIHSSSRLPKNALCCCPTGLLSRMDTLLRAWRGRIHAPVFGMT